MGFFDKLKAGLKKTSRNFSEQINSILAPMRKVDENLLSELEEMLIMADVSVDTSLDIIAQLKKTAQLKKINDAALLKEELKDIIENKLYYENTKLNFDKKPLVILVIGVNGVGKTTTIAKLSHLLKSEGQKVILAAADTFRAAAIEQLSVWAERAGVEVVSHREGADPAAVVFDTINAAKKRNSDVIICDTAGRLHNKKHLMAELEKINKIIDTNLPNANKEVFLVIDATTGQNALNQAKEFAAVCNITGLVLTKLDGSAKGGMVISIKDELGIPVKFIGVGEKLDDMYYFDGSEFASALFE